MPVNPLTSHVFSNTSIRKNRIWLELLRRSTTLHTSAASRQSNLFLTYTFFNYYWCVGREHTLYRHPFRIKKSDMPTLREVPGSWWPQLLFTVWIFCAAYCRSGINLSGLWSCGGGGWMRWGTVYLWSGCCWVGVMDISWSKTTPSLVLHNKVALSSSSLSLHRLITEEHGVPAPGFGTWYVVPMRV